MPRQRRRIVLTTVVICLALISIPFLLTWRQTQKERLNRQLIAAIKRLDAKSVHEALLQHADPNASSNPDAPSLFVRWMQGWFGRDPAATVEADTALNEAISAKDDVHSQADEEAKIQIVKDLLDSGADPNKQYRTVNPPLISDPPLVAASRKGPIEVVRLLLDKKANINAQTHSGNTALIEAALWGRTEVVLLLIQRGANVNAKDHFDSTALMSAADHDDIKAEEALLQHNADVNVMNYSKMTALKFARKGGHKASEQLLLKNGAKE